MQPYVFPYLGYFQLIKAVDIFVFYDDVNFIKRGWINRNNIQISKTPNLLSFPCVKASQNKLIKDIEIKSSSEEYLKILNKIHVAYEKAPYYEEFMPFVEKVFNEKVTTISEFASNSIIIISNYLRLKIDFKYSSIDFKGSKGLEKAERLIHITKSLNSNCYVNAIGGRELYSKSIFKNSGIDLQFVSPTITPYKQFNEQFIPCLSIIDVIMFNGIEKTNELLTTSKII